MVQNYSRAKLYADIWRVSQIVIVIRRNVMLTYFIQIIRSVTISDFVQQFHFVIFS